MSEESNHKTETAQEFLENIEQVSQDIGANKYERKWHTRAVCQCGWHSQAPHGIKRSAANSRDVCPKCGRSWILFQIEVMRFEPAEKTIIQKLLGTGEKGAWILK